MGPKNCIIDINVPLEDPNSQVKLHNGNARSVFIPYHGLLELNKIKKDLKLRHIVPRVIVSRFQPVMTFYLRAGR